MRRRVLFVGRTRYRLPLAGSVGRKFDALREELDVRVLASAHAGSPVRDETFRLVPPLRPRPLDGLAFHATLPLRVARELRQFRPDAAIAQGPYDAAALLVGRVLARSRVPIVLELHGDWRTATRLYGSRRRRLLSGLLDRVGAAAVRRADAVRTISEFTSGLVREQQVEPAAVFPAYVDLSAFTAEPVRPLPERPTALFVGVLERYKGVDVLVEAWRSVRGAHLRIVGEGPLAAEVKGLDVTPRLTQEEVARALDESSLLVLPSRSEGLPRIVIEAFCRGRPVVGTRAGGVPDIVRDGVNGLLVEPEDPAALAAALQRALSDRALLERLASGARESAGAWVQTPEEYASRVRSVVERAVAAA
jgi:glycogen synthase